MEINKYNWEKQLAISNIIVGCRLKLISVSEEEKRMSVVLKDNV